MNCTLKGSFLFSSRFDEEKRNKIFTFLKERSIYSDLESKDFFYNKTIYIELKSTPQVFLKLRNTFYFYNTKELNEHIYSVSIMELSELGVVVLISSDSVDHTIFIPSSEIISIHSISSEHIELSHKAFSGGEYEQIYCEYCNKLDCSCCNFCGKSSCEGYCEP